MTRYVLAKMLKSAKCIKFDSWLCHSIPKLYKQASFKEHTLHALASCHSDVYQGLFLLGKHPLQCFSLALSLDKGNSNAEQLCDFVNC